MEEVPGGEEGGRLKAGPGRKGGGPGSGGERAGAAAGPEAGNAGAEFVVVGRVAGAQGVRGALRIAAFSGEPAGILRATILRLSRAGREARPAEQKDFEVTAARPRGGCAVLSLAGIGTPEEARGWAGALASMRREELPPAGEDEYYFADLLGCAVVDPAGEPIGTVKGVERGPAHDWLVVDRQGDEGMLPMVGAFIRSVDIRARRIVAAPPPGW